MPEIIYIFSSMNHEQLTTRQNYVSKNPLKHSIFVSKKFFDKMDNTWKTDHGLLETRVALISKAFNDFETASFLLSRKESNALSRS